MANKAFRYEQVVSKIEETISALQLKIGDKIPSIRKVSEQLKVSLTTVNQAYSILAAKGIIISRPGSGFYLSSFVSHRQAIVNNQTYIPLPSTVDISAMATTMIKNTKKYGVYSFSTLAPPNEFIPITKINKALQAAVKDLGNDNFQYPYYEGHPTLLNQIARHSFNWKKSLVQDKIIVTNGCMEAINLCLDVLTKPGDIVAIESPTYAGILQCLESKGLKALGISVKPVTGLNLDELEVALSKNTVTACIFMPACHNPLGCAMPEENKVKLVNILGEKGIPLIEDDTLGEIYFGKTRPLPAKVYDTYDNVLYCSSFSKSLTPGFRIGWVSAGKYQPELEKFKFAANIATNGLLQDAIGRYLETGDFNMHLKKLRLSVHTQVIKYRNAIQTYFPDGVRISVPAGGYSLWIKLPDQVEALELQNLALKSGIGFCPGNIFSTSNIFHNYIRINCCPLWNHKIEDALKTLGKIVKALDKQPLAVFSNVL